MSSQRPQLNLNQQLVIVTGASRGLGAAIAQAFLREGAKVVINFLNSADRAQALAATAPDRALAVQADVRDPAAVAAMVARASQHFGQPVHTIVNNALPAFQFNGDARPHADLVQNPVVPYHDYTAAKAALLAFTRTLSHELGADGITVNMVSGGLLRTTDASAATPDAVFDMIAAGTPLREVTTPEQFADAVLFFASPWSRAVTGQNLIVDGGLVKG